MKQPVEPSKEDCCNSGCNPCIFDVYEKQLKLYKKFLETGQTTEDIDESENALSQLEYSSFILVAIVEICKAHKQLFFERLIKDNKKVRWKPGNHFLLKYNDKDKSCTRAYTPIKCKKQNKEHDFSIIVKVYENGLVTNYLNQLNIGDETLWRGPYGSYIMSSKHKRIIMVAQGTGIAPFISIIERILENEDDMTRIILFYCTRDEHSIIMREELYKYRQYWNFSYKIFLNPTSIINTKCKYQEPILHHKLDLEDLNLLKPFSLSDQMLLCGSQDFMKTFKELLRKENNLLGNIHLF